MDRRKSGERSAFKGCHNIILHVASEDVGLHVVHPIIFNLNFLKNNLLQSYNFSMIVASFFKYENKGFCQLMVLILTFN